MSGTNGTDDLPTPTEAEPSLITTPTTPSEGGTTPDPSTLPPEPKQPEQAPDDSPVAEPTPLQPTDLSFPEGVEVSDELRDEFVGVFNNAELDAKGRAQALVDLHTKAVQKASEASSQAWTEMQTQWRDEVRADTDIGGAKLEPALANIGKLLTEYGTPELNQVFDMTGAGNNVHVIKFLNTVASKLTEGGPVIGQPSKGDASAASRLFPSMKG